MENIHIAPMAKEHTAQLAEIERLCFSKPWSENALLQELSNNAAHFLTAENNGQAVGYIGLHIVCDEAYIANLAVHPDFRRKGIARQLLQTAEGLSLGMGCRFISLEVRKSNNAAISLYKSEGFKTAGYRKNFYSDPKEDAAILTLLF
ncbi:MAG: ribosomal protein S18-alanine N-acetyltransferase [Acutalibacteraceae bacterium]